jgi:putative methionine-R-sulfoxide reductase with GAF domain
MTSLRGPDPYAIAEERLAPLLAHRPAPLAAICRTLQESVPTYTWVALARHRDDGVQLLAQHGTPRRASPLPTDCAAQLTGDATLVVHDVAAEPACRDCFPGARALIAVPSGRETQLLVTSEHQGAFGLADRALLEMIARSLAERDAATPEG